jgi:hypothetical protein
MIRNVREIVYAANRMGIRTPIRTCRRPLARTLSLLQNNLLATLRQIETSTR